MTSLQQIQRIYDSRAETYDRSVGCLENLVLGDLRHAFGAELRGETLEIAIGTGLNLPWYNPAVTRATGIDLSASMLSIAATRAATLGRKIDLVQMDAQHLAFPDHSFDTVAVSLCLCTIPDPPRAIREFARVCRPDRQVVVLEHVRSPVWPVYALERLWTPIQERTLGCSLVRQTIKLLQSEGFEIISERQKLFGIFRLVVAHPPHLPSTTTVYSNGMNLIH